VRPEPESLLLTVGKIKKLVGDENVGIPALLDQRLPRAFSLDAGKLPTGKEADELIEPFPVLAFNYFDPPLLAETTVHEGTLVYLRTPYFKGRVIEYGGVWKESSQWWSPLFWQTSFWDVELENRSVYRLSQHGDKWFVTGEYD
jgi:protein ImuB